MKFIAKKSTCCTEAGKIVNCFQTDNLETMAQYIIGAYAYGNNQADRRDDDFACVFADKYEFEELFDEIPINQFIGKNYNAIPYNKRLLYICGKFGWDLIPVGNNPQEIIDTLLSLDWSDLEIDYNNE